MLLSLANTFAKGEAFILIFDDSLLTDSSMRGSTDTSSGSTDTSSGSTDTSSGSTDTSSG